MATSSVQPSDEDDVAMYVSQDQSSNGSHYGIGDITKPIGVSVRYRELKGAFTSSLENLDVTYNYTSIGDLIKEQNVKVKVRPILLSFSGLPESGKSTALDQFLDHHVERSPKPASQYEPVTDKSFRPPTIQGVNNYTSIGDLIKEQNVKLKVRPILVSFSGQPESRKSIAMKQFLDHHVERSPKPASQYEPLTDKSFRPPTIQGVTQYELIADGSDPLVTFTLSEAMKESSFTFGVLSAFKNILATTGRVPVLDNTGEGTRYFKDNKDLENFCMFIYRYLCNQTSIPKDADDADAAFKAALGLKHSIPDCLTLINIWDHSISNTVRHLLSALQGHLYNHHMFLFLDLERDLNKLDEPPDVQHTDKEGAVFMKWRPRLHYLLRSAWATEEKGKKRRKATLLAKSVRKFSSSVKDDIAKLEDHVKPIAKHIGVAKLLERDIEVVNLDTNNQKRIYRKIQRIASYTSPEEIPLSWLFLRGSFYHSDKIIISKIDLQKMAHECGMNAESLTEFCKFYTSFGSIIDLSLANSEYLYVIINPVKFLELLNKFLYPKNDELEQYPTIELGIVPEEYCIAALGYQDWMLFMNALVSLQVATRITGGSLEMPPSGYTIEQMAMYHYISLCCKGEPITDVDPHAMYLINNIDTPHFFEQVTVAEQLLKSMRDLIPKLHPCTKANQLLIKTSDTTVTMSFHSPVIKIRLSDPNSIVCSHVVKTFKELATSAHKASGVKVKYKFVSLCYKNEDISNIASILSSRYHVLPHSGHCEHCTAAGRNDELLKVWNEALEKEPIPRKFKATGEIVSKELSHIVDKMSLYSIQPEVFAETFIPDYLRLPQFNQLKRHSDSLIREVLFSWYEKIRQNTNGGPEPRRALAEKLSELGDKVSIDHNEPQRIRFMFQRLAKRIDVYFKVKIFGDDYKSPLMEKDYEFLYQAMKSEHIIEYSVSTVVIQGEARVGKTCFKSLLLSLPYDERSTNYIEDSKVAFGSYSVRHYGHTGKCWKFVSDEEMEKKVLAEVNWLQEIDKTDTLPNTSAESNDDSEESSDSDSADSDDEDDNVNTVSSNSSVEESISDNVASEVPQQMSVSSKTSDDHNDRSNKSVQSAVQLIRPKSLIKRLREKYKNFDLRQVDKLSVHQDWLYFFDSGGQIQFQKLLPAFMPCTSNFILVINLAKSLSDRSSTIMQLDDKVAIESSSEYSLTVEDVIKQIFSAVVCRAHEHMSVIKNDLILSKYITPPPEKLNVITVATHCDELEKKETQQELELQTKLNKIYDRLENKCKPAVYKKETSDSGSIFFKVDGRKAKSGEYDDPIVEEIAEKLKEHSYTIKVPLKWHCLLTLLRIVAKENDGILHLSYCQEIGQGLNMSGDKVVSTLKFFHVLKLLFYFNDSPAKDLVFVSLESVTDVICQLVVDAYHSHSKPSIHPIRERRIGTEGIITVEVLRDKLRPKLKSFSDVFLKLFVHLLIASEIPERGSYFMPALLPSFDTSKANPFPDVETVPLLFYFKNGVPMGLFCALLVQLSAKAVSEVNKLSWHIVKEDNFSNYFNLEVDEFEGSFILIEQIQCIEVHCDKTEGRVKAKDDIAEAINVVIKQHRLSQDDKPVETFYCSCKEKDVTKHVVEWTGTKWSRKCSILGKKQKEYLTEQYWSWFVSKQQFTDVSNGIERPDILQNVSQMSDPHHEVVEYKSNNGLEDNDTLVKADQVKPHHSPSSDLVHTYISTSSSSEAKPVPNLKVDTDSVRIKLEQVLTKNHVALNDAFKISLKSIVDTLFQAGLISQDVYEAQTYDAIIGSFKASMKFQRSQPKLEAYCTKFFKALSNVGGPVTEAAQAIQEEWIEAVRDELGIELQLNYL